MKPLKLKIEGFGPYLKPVEIDFRELDDSLTLISGNTGAGKTTIFDAICCALYGDTSGKDRNFSEMRNKSAEAGDITEIDFSFELHGDTYQVVRRPSYSKIGKNGKETKVSARADLILPDNSTLSKVKVVNDKLREILGIEKDEFKQIMMIAQNDFMAMVKETGGAQEKTFNRIFDATLYKNFSDKIREEVRDSFNNSQRYLGLILNNVKASGLEFEPSVVNENYIDLDYLSKKLNQERERFERQLPKLQESQKSISKNIDQIKLELHDSKTINDKFDQLEQVERKLNKLNNQEGKINKLVRLKEQAEKARDIVSESYNRHEHYTNVKSSLIKNLKDSEEQLESINQNLTKVDKLLESYPKERLNELRMNYENLKKTLPQYEELESYQQTLRDLIEKTKADEDLIKSIQSKKNEYEENLEKITIIPDEQLESKFELQVRSEADFRDNVADLKQVINLLEKLREDARNLVSEKERHIEITNKRDELEQKLHELNHIFVANNAAYLARDLEENKPCPVCGSLEHPNPCTAEFTESEVTSQTLETVNDELSGRQKEYIEQIKVVEEAKGKLKTDYKELDLNIRNLVRRAFTEEDNVAIESADLIGELVKEDFTLNFFEDAINVLAEYCAAVAYEFRLKRSELNVLREALEEKQKKNKSNKIASKALIASISDLEEDLKNATKTLEVNKSDLLKTETIIDSLTEQLEYESKEIAEGNLNKSFNQLKRFEDNLKELNERRENLLKNRNTESGKISNTRTSLEENEAKLSESQETLSDNLQKAGFKSIEDYKASVLESKKLKEIEATIQKYHDELNRANSTYSELTEFLENSATRF